ncbi:MAG: metallophosphoesterase, partial [Melioribacteraceae bacterium]
MNGRREFLKRLGIISAGSLLANKIIANPYNPVRIFPNHYNSVKIKGAVKSGGKSLKGVPVTDGQVVVQTSGDGTFEIISGNQQRFVYISIPSGYLINQNETGTALFYKRIKPNQKNEMFVEFDLTKNPNEDNEHSFLLLADPQTRTADDIKFYFDSLVPDIKKTASQFAKENLFGLACGDIMWDKLEFFPEYEKSVKEFGIPCFQVLGNHDCDVLAKTDE